MDAGSPSSPDARSDRERRIRELERENALLQREIQALRSRAGSSNGDRPPQVARMSTLRETERRLSELLQLAPAFICVLRGPDLVFELANDRYFQLVGHRDLIGKTVLDALPEVADQPFPRILRRVYETGEPFRHEEMLVRLARGPGNPLEDRWVDFVYLPLLDDAGAVEGIFVHGIDITNRKQAEDALRQAHDLLAGIIGGSHDAIAAIDTDYRLVAANPAFRQIIRKLFGAEVKVGSRLLDALDALPEQRDLAERLWARALAGATATETAAFGDPRRDQRIFDLRFYPIRDGEGRIVAAGEIATDVTERVRAEEALREREQKLQQLNDNLERTIAERTRELHRRAGQLTRLTVEVTDAEQRERQRLAELLHDHVQQLLVAAKLRARMIPQREECAAPEVEALGNILDEVLEATRSLAAELSPRVLYEHGLAAGLRWLAKRKEERYGLRTTVEAADGVEPRDSQIAVLLFQAARELLFNIVKHAGVKEAVLRLDGADDGIHLVVEDRGSGFDQAVLDRSTEGGLGLFGIRERLTIFGGAMTIESEPGDGTRIELVAPVEVVSQAAGDEAPGDGAAPDPTASHANGAYTILVVDDHRLVRQGFVTLLSEHDDMHIVGEASNGQEAIELAGSLQPDVILMDVNMPVVDGIEATRRIKSLYPATRIIGLSMQDDPATVSAMRRAGADDHLNKDGNEEVLVEAIRRG